MREIKFRAWDIVSQEMIELWESKYYELFCSTPDSKPYELMQFTGLKDKNGKEIYEGDILRWRKDKYTVIWNKKDCGFVVEWLQKPTIHEELDSDFTIIGNIYENPELLK